MIYTKRVNLFRVQQKDEEMKNYESDETFLARWAVGDLSDEELLDFQKTEAYKEFEQINQEAQGFMPPPIDKKQALISVKEKITFRKQDKGVRKLWFAVAASIALIVGTFGLLNSSITYQTNVGEQLAVHLPDGSSVQLNANSELSHKRFFWKNNRQLELKGEGYFEVEKGQKFEVTTSQGSVTVLGTKFNVKSRANRFELNCFEGSVRFDNFISQESHILKQGDQIVLADATTKAVTQKSIKSTPDWIKGMSTFKNEPFGLVLEEIKLQYQVNFEYRDIDLDKKFTGSFVYDNLENALKTTLMPMGLSYKLSKDKKTVTIH